MMLTNIALRTVFRSSLSVLRESVRTPQTCCAALPSGHNVSKVSTTFPLPGQIRCYARTTKAKVAPPKSLVSDLTPSMLKMEYAAIPFAQTADDIVKRLLSLELASHSDKMALKTEQLIAKVQRDESDRSSVEVKIAILTGIIRNLEEHMFKHHKDKANKRRMLMAIDRRKKMLKNLRLERYDAFQKVCEQLEITYTFPPEYYRKATKRWIAKKAFCIKVFNEVQKMKAEKKLQEATDKKSPGQEMPSLEKKKLKN
ncbi:small ribosomal subunit protein uS15m [Stigmatopora nigra]